VKRKKRRRVAVRRRWVEGKDFERGLEEKKRLRPVSRRVPFAVKGLRKVFE